MTTDEKRWRQLNDLLARALEQPAAERAAWVAEACGDDAALKAELLELLEYDVEKTGDLRASIASASARATDALIGTMRVIASIEEPTVIEQILDHLGHTAEPIDPAHPAERRRRAIAWSDRFVLFITTRAPLQGRAAFGSRRDAPAFSSERGRFTRLDDQGSGRLRRIAASMCPQQTGFSSPRRFRA